MTQSIKMKNMFSQYRWSGFRTTFEGLTVGSQGLAVSGLQRSLNKRLRSLGMDRILAVTPHGTFDAETLVAIKYLQCVSGLAVNGTISSQTQDFILKGAAGLTTLSIGSYGISVLAVQRTIQRSAPQHSLFDPLTQQAVIAYQQTVGLVADGIVGPQTWEALVRLRLGTVSCLSLLPNIYVNPSR